MDAWAAALSMSVSSMPRHPRLLLAPPAVEPAPWTTGAAAAANTPSTAGAAGGLRPEARAVSSRQCRRPLAQAVPAGCGLELVLVPQGPPHWTAQGCAAAAPPPRLSSMPAGSPPQGRDMPSWLRSVGVVEAVACLRSRWAWAAGGARYARLPAVVEQDAAASACRDLATPRASHADDTSGSLQLSVPGSRQAQEQAQGSSAASQQPAPVQADHRSASGAVLSSMLDTPVFVTAASFMRRALSSEPIAAGAAAPANGQVASASDGWGRAPWCKQGAAGHQLC
jgi:hypothetical protein